MRLTLALVGGLALAACQPTPPAPAETTETAAPAASDASVVDTAGHTFGPEVSAEDLAAHIKTLSSDDFEGRGPGGRGEELTLAYIRGQFERLGLEPGNKGDWYQNVPMVETTAQPTPITITVGGETIELAYGSEQVIGTRSGQSEVKLESSDMVFVGYGTVAPEAGWNDYEGLDVKGKTVVMLVNDPGFHIGDETLFAGKRMTYYGRWSYKYEEAARQGAAAALVIHDDAGAGYGWDVVENSWSGAQFDLPTEHDPEPRLPLQGWISGPKAAEIFAKAGQDLEALRTAANQRGFRAVALDAKASTTLTSTTRSGESRNVMGLLRGSSQPDEVMVYMAHWDHLGRTFGGAGDRVYNGAVDNATGLAAILEIAERFVTQGTPPQRSILFLAVALEESGLLGSKYYVANPVYPLASTVAVVNIDAIQPVGRTKDFVVIGHGSSELEDILKPIADSQGRVLTPEDAPEKGYFYRSDHFNFAKAGVPALYAKGGIDHVEKGAEFGRQVGQDYTTNRYHKPADEFDPNWDLSGIVEDVNALYGVGSNLAASEAWPHWYEGNEFRAAREASLSEAR
jgi:Zn-dependent M28 family amino/carboxypeptidase